LGKNWTPTLDDVEAARAFLRQLGLTGPLADGWERRTRQIEEEIKARPRSTPKVP
jgi:hypothetical protein